ncbi:hypothetical protein Ngar_c02080 [Candidatus Nitrososphaera gargensis Ga9.2]|uniref:Uncharacterized protein n=1 Tax=Nitrososphaera gargensis (strain Ga9.2) TaxID=1237085 RepID=K0I7B9_NITGG|nr:hypothetical protein Ngar_c02080 [Candidatus Nitrososphaera gargensis Ga9.2]
MTMKENLIDWQVSTTTAATLNALYVVDNGAPLSNDDACYYHNHQELVSTTTISRPSSFKKMKGEESRELS